MILLYNIPICVSPEGNFDIGAWVGDGGDHLGPPKSQKIVRTKFVHTSGTLFPKSQKHIFKISSYIQKNTANPINAFKITIYNTKHTKSTKTNPMNPKKSKKQRKV